MSHPRGGPYLMSIDGGTESLRVGVFDLEGKLLATAAQTYGTSFPHAGWAEQDPEEWWQALIGAARNCLARAPIQPQDIVGISLDATTCTLVPLDRQGRHVRPALLWMDVRASELLPR